MKLINNLGAQELVVQASLGKMNYKGKALYTDVDMINFRDIGEKISRYDIRDIKENIPDCNTNWLGYSSSISNSNNYRMVQIINGKAKKSAKKPLFWKNL